MRRTSLLLLLFALLCASVVGDDAECASVCAARLSAATSELQLAASQQQEAVVASERKACDLRVAEESTTTSKVRAQLKAAESQAEELRAASAGTEGELSALNVRANQLEAQLAASQKERTSTLETLALRGGELEKVQRTLKEVQEGRAQDKAALAALRAELDTAKVAQQLQLAALQSELDSLRSSVLPPVLRPLLAAAGDVCTQRPVLLPLPMWQPPGVTFRRRGRVPPSSSTTREAWRWWLPPWIPCAVPHRRSFLKCLPLGSAASTLCMWFAWS